MDHGLFKTFVRYVCNVTLNHSQLIVCHECKKTNKPSDFFSTKVKSQNLILSKTSKVFMENSHNTSVRDMMDMVSEKIGQRESTQGLKQQCKIEVDCFIPAFNCLYLLE